MEVFVFVSVILIICVVLSHVFNSRPLSPISDVDMIRIAAKNKNYILHEESYRNGREIYIPERFKNVRYDYICNNSKAYDALQV